jgi:hypothetical protein
MQENGQIVYPLDPMYINERRVAGLVGAKALADELDDVTSWNEKKTSYLRSVRCAELLRDWLEIAGPEIPSLQAAIVTGALKPPALFSYEGNLYFDGVRVMQPKPNPSAHVVMKGLLDGADVRFFLALNHDHVVVGSPGNLLTGQVSDLFVLAQASRVARGQIRAVPIFIGYLRKQGAFEFIKPTGRNEVFVDSIDNFSAVETVAPPSLKQLGVLRDLSEEAIKVAFAEIIGEPDIPKDWGGERSDLYTTYVRLDGQRVSTAFAFKGPAGGSKFREMQVADLGKNGDQIERLCTEPAELLVIQHCHNIGSAVRNTVRAFCNQVGRQRRYCLVPGSDTFRVLRAYGKCGV